jgi:DNA repair photolyase
MPPPPQEKWKTRSLGADWSETRDQARGRGALSNATGRFEKQYAEPFDDGWEKDKGCEHGCIYCYARPNHAYRGLSPGLDFESKIFVKPGAAALLERELSKKTYKPGLIMLAGDTDIYQPLERELKITRSILEVLSRYDHPACLITKSALITRDLDILAPMAAKGLVSVAVSFTTLDRRLARTMEPRCAAPHRRVETMRELSAAGIPVSVMTAPLIPALNEPEMEALLEAAAEAGATRAGYVLLRLPLEIAGLFTEWLDTHYPDRARRVMSLLRSCHAGEDYRSKWKIRQKGDGPYAQLIQQRFQKAVTRLGLNRLGFELRTDLFRPPTLKDASGQMNLFDGQS